jgi:hypothetical protein
MLACSALLMTACLVAPVVPPQGFVYTGYKAPLDLDQNKTAVAAKTGRASTVSIFGIIAWGDASIDAAARDGGIQTIESADYAFTNVFGLYQQYTTIVHGN